MPVWQSLPLLRESILNKDQRSRATALVTIKNIRTCLAHGSSLSKQLWQLSKPSLPGLGRVAPTFTMAWLVVLLIGPKSRTKESWKEPASYLPLLFLLNKIFQSPSLAKATMMGLRILSAPLKVIRNQMTQTPQYFQLCPPSSIDRALVQKVCILVYIHPIS